MPETTTVTARGDGLIVTRLSAHPAALGESPLWDPETARLWWIDGVAGQIHGFGSDGAEIAPVQVGRHIGGIALATDGRLAAARDHDFLLCDPASGDIEILLTLGDTDPKMRLNDVKLDRQGRLLCAGMGRGGDPLGALHQLDGAGRHRILATGLRIGNGICFSPEGDTLYFSDTPARRLFACDYNPATGQASEPRLHIDTSAWGSGVDGATVDRDGNLWAAMIHSAEIGCFASDGTLSRRFPAPVDLPSSLAFGGTNLSRLFVTSIRDSGTGRAVSTHPDGGHLFAVDGIGATGLPEARFSPEDPSARPPA
ncbi:SMP-30/gluconolactonase/LRE family protein [Amorphus sp. 3PC139-8]|uniref:SMP-30/gluconolactonase/LRE family protein n=1 Tax=Amorphus sp. 3PC139-8 TaxID=2735676 RepID=UPI00345D6485